MPRDLECKVWGFIDIDVKFIKGLACSPLNVELDRAVNTLVDATCSRTFKK